MRVILAGLDGATFDLILPWIRQKKLPTFEKLINNGAHGKLNSTIPPHTAAAWTSIITGKNPGKHGVFYFIDISSPDKIRLKSSSDIQCHTLWDLLKFSGKKSIFINVPLSYPPKDFDGIIVGGMETPSVESRITNNEEVREFLLKTGYEIDIKSDEYFGLFYGDKQKLLKRLMEIEDKRMKLTVHLLDNHPWHFSMVVFNLLDRCQHVFWKYQGEKGSKHSDYVLKAYQRADGYLKEIIERFLDDETLLTVVSDHGFGPLKRYFYVNEWLRDRGLLKLKKTYYSGLKSQLLRVLLKIPRLVFPILPDTVQRRASKMGLKMISFNPHSFMPLDEVDFVNSKAFSPAAYGMVKIIDREYTEKTMKTIVEGLHKVVDEDNNLKVVKKIYDKEELYGPNCGEEAPDLIIEPREDYLIRETIGLGEAFKTVGEVPWNGTHTRAGILLMYGKGVKRRFKLGGSSVLDITPTILHVLGIPIPKDVDGRALTECVNLKRGKSSIDWVSSEKRGFVYEYTSAEEEEVKSRLRGLGYL